MKCIAAYFKGQTAFSRCFLEFEKKWKSYGRVAGIIILKNASEKRAESDRWNHRGKRFMRDTVRFSFSEFEKGLRRTKFAPVDFEKCWKHIGAEKSYPQKEKQIEGRAQKADFFKEAEQYLTEYTGSRFDSCFVAAEK